MWIFVAVMGVAMSSCKGKEYRRCQGATWNTTFTITYEADRPLDDSIHAVMRQIDQSLSAFNPSSTVSRINRNETDTCDAWFEQVFAISKDVSARTREMFDPTASPLINLWGFGYEGRDGAVPSDSAVAEALLSVGIADCSVREGRVVKKSAATTFNFSAVAKGFGCDMVGEMLRRNGCDNFMVEIGGEMALAGVNPKGKQWRVMIDAPVEGSLPGREGAATVSLTDCGLATSGNYRNFREDAAGRSYGHTISPATGRPVQTDVVSATVIAPTAALADAYATAFMVLGAEGALEVANADPAIECLLILADNSVVVSAGWRYGE